MDIEASFFSISPQVFNGENDQIWDVRMESYMDARDLWEVVEEDYKITPL